MPALRIGLFWLVLPAILLGGAAPSPAENWPQFRGATGFGKTGERNLPITWGGANQEDVAWTTPLIGQGHASPIVWGDRVFVCTARWPEAVRRREEVIPQHHVLCYATGDGELLWDTLVPPGPWLRTDFRSGPQFELLAVNDLADGNHASAAVAAGRMFLVGMRNVY